MNNDTILVHTSDAAITRRRGPQELKVEVLAENVNLFLSGIESILERAPEQVGKFQFDEIVISAEISANGKLVPLGSGIESTAKGGLEFKFRKKGP